MLIEEEKYKYILNYAYNICEFDYIKEVPSIKKRLVIFNDENRFSEDAVKVVAYLNENTEEKNWLLSSWKEYEDIKNKILEYYHNYITEYLYYFC